MQQIDKQKSRKGEEEVSFQNTRQTWELKNSKRDHYGTMEVEGQYWSLSQSFYFKLTLKTELNIFTFFLKVLLLLLKKIIVRL